MEFYAQNNVLLLTGATGFIGKVILEKVLRSLPQVKKVYVLIRSSTTATAQERLENDIFGSRIWETLRAQFPNQARFREEVSNKVIAVQGDIGLDRLGLSDQDLAMIQKDTAVFINSAATIDFNESLKKAILLNTEGPLRACEVMKEMPHLKAFVQISTSFVNAHLKNHFTKEQIYPHPFGMPEDVYKMVKAMSDEEIEAYEKDVVRRTYPNTYTFTKSLAEHLLQSRYQKMNLPLVIVRPSIVGGAITEPQPGWVESMGGLTGLSVSIGLGLVQEWIAEEERTGCLIPVDIVAKCVLMAAVATAAGHPQAGSVLPIVHVGTSSHCPSTIKFVLGAALAYWRKAPASVGRASDDIRADLYTPRDFKFRYQQRFRKELALCTESEGQEHRRMLERAKFIPELYGWVCTTDWVFETKNVFALDLLAPEELKSGLEKGVNWETYLRDYHFGIQEYILGEIPDRSIKMDFNIKMQKVYVSDNDRKQERKETARL